MKKLTQDELKGLNRLGEFAWKVLGLIFWIALVAVLALPKDMDGLRRTAFILLYMTGICVVPGSICLLLHRFGWLK